ncbi:guanine deaminase [Arcanobacterium wilhelmae]|uniref:Guanine deaminase n=1 Tax=Arcanobacterium wilhelmae TaxID=1803177 RepID=A0ABT9NBR3_9ACTO|nr:guanine deaminase [Arcanobacterium wilhelmae]MDP9800851.1 guanine deaminase [Arcanobacterium wilhelmae]WFN90223.1 guanine deaminase [Arcanobacterium wilhelmae]
MLAIRSAYLSFRANPFEVPFEEATEYTSDALIMIDDAGRVTSVGSAPELLPQLPPGTEIHHYPHHLVIPGFVDTHVHYSQTQMIAAYGEQLLDWLREYTYATELQFENPQHAAAVARVFLDEQLRNGTTTSAVYATVFPQSVDAIFKEARERGMRLIAGKVAMDRGAPAGLLDTPQRAYAESAELIARWHGTDRLEYAITPRFAPTSSREQLEALGQLAHENPTALIQTHVSENPAEVALVAELFPERAGYLDVYDHYGLVRPRAIFGHGIHLTDAELATLAERGAAIAHCPTSNFFLGSGALNVQRAADAGVRLALGTDLGAGTSFSMIRTLGAAYSAAQANGVALDAGRALYLATRGGAEALGLGEKIGQIAPGFEADLAVLDLHSTPIIEYRMQFADTLREALFIQMTMGDDRAIAATYVAGRRAYTRE